MPTAAPSKHTPLWQKLIVALTVVTMLFADQIASFLVVRNRFYHAWDSTDAWLLILVIVILSALAIIISVVFKKLRWQRCSRIWNHLFVLAVISGAMSLLHLTNSYPRWLQIGWLAIMLGLGFSLGYPSSRLVAFTKNACLIFSPLVLILCAQLLAARTWECPNSSQEEFAQSRSEATPIFLFIFDGWPFPRITDDQNEFLPQYENLRRLSEQSFNFVNARSPYHFTTQSLPRIIYQTDYWFTIRDDGCVFETLDGEVVSTQFPSVFLAAQKQDYNTAMVGFFLPYQKILGDQVDYYRTYRYEVKKETLLDRMAWVVIGNFGHLTDPISIGINTRILNRFTSRHHYEINARTQADIWSLIDNAPPNSLCITHWPLPHAPYIFDRDGSYSGPHDGVKGKYDAAPERQDEQLLYLDKVIGQLVDRLKTAGKFDDALLILTADHGWSKDIEINRRVPLIIKVPHQNTAQRVERVACNNHISAIIASALQGRLDEQTALSLINEDRLSCAH